MPASIVLDGESLRIEDVAAVADGANVSLAASARARMARTRAIVDAIVERRDVVYGITTGFGKLSDVAIAWPSCRPTWCGATPPAWGRCCRCAKCAR
jgi:histidine ammonia-lyase